MDKWKITATFVIFHCLYFFPYFLHDSLGLSIGFQQGCAVIEIEKSDALSQEKYFKKAKFFQQELHLYTLVMFSNFKAFDFRMKGKNGSKSDLQLYQHTYRRFNWRYQTACAVVLLYLISNGQNENDNFPMTMTTISKAGFGNAENSIVYIVNPSGKFEKELCSYRENVDIKVPNIYGHIALINLDKERYSMYCHFCVTHERISWMVIPNNGTLMNKEIFNLFRALVERRRSLEQNIAFLTEFQGEKFSFPRCDRPEKYYRKNTTFVQTCRGPILLYMAKSLMNYTVTIRTFEENRRDAVHERANPRVPHLTSFPTITKFLDDSLQQTLRNVIMIKFELSWLYCAPENKITLLGWQLYFKNFDLPTWFGLIIVCLASYFLTGGKPSLLNLLQPLKIFLQQGLDDGKPSTSLAFILSTATCLSMIYQSAMSTDFLSLSDFPELENLLQQGYRVRLESASEKQFVLNPANIEKTQLKLYSKYEASFFYEPDWIPTRRIPVNFTDLVDHMWNEKYLIIMVGLDTEAIPNFRGNLFKVGTSFCTMHKHHASFSDFGQYTWSYMSSAFSRFWLRLTESGFVQHWFEIRRQATTFGVLDRSKVISSWWIRLVPDPSHYGINVLLTRICIAYFTSLGVILVIYMLHFFAVSRNGFSTRCWRQESITSVAF